MRMMGKRKCSRKLIRLIKCCHKLVLKETMIKVEGKRLSNRTIQGSLKDPGINVGKLIEGTNRKQDGEIGITVMISWIRFLKGSKKCMSKLKEGMNKDLKEVEESVSMRIISSILEQRKRCIKIIRISK